MEIQYCYGIFLEGKEFPHRIGQTEDDAWYSIACSLFGHGVNKSRNEAVKDVKLHYKGRKLKWSVSRICMMIEN